MPVVCKSPANHKTMPGRRPGDANNPRETIRHPLALALSFGLRWRLLACNYSQTTSPNGSAFWKKNRMLHHGKMTIDYHWNTPLNPLWEYPRSYSLPSSWFTGNSYQTQKITLIIDHPRDTTVWWCWKNLLPHDQPFWECGVPFGSASHAFHPKVICV